MEKTRGNSTIEPTPQTAPIVIKHDNASLRKGSYVKILGQDSVGRIDKINGNNAIVIIGNMYLSLKTSMLTATDKPKDEERPIRSFLSRSTRENISEKSLNFKPDIDVRGMNGNEAVNAVTYFVEDAILLGITPLRILHGTGTGYLRQVIRQYLDTVPQVKRYHDEHIQLGGAGITIVEL